EGGGAGFQPFVENNCLEQRSREVTKDKTRIRFAHPEPPAQGSQDGFIRHRLLPGQGPFSLKTEGRATRNLLPYESGSRDVLENQRTGSIDQLGSWGTEDQDLRRGR